MKTLFLFEDDDGAHFFELEGDYTRFEGVYINSELPEGAPHTQEEYDALQNELTLLVYGAADADGEITGDLLPDELIEPSKDWDHFVRCGFVA